MGEPEHISIILKRVFPEIGNRSQSGGCPLDSKRKAPTLPARQSSVGVKKNGKSTA